MSQLSAFGGEYAYAGKTALGGGGGQQKLNRGRLQALPPNGDVVTGSEHLFRFGTPVPLSKLMLSGAAETEPPAVKRPTTCDESQHFLGVLYILIFSRLRILIADFGCFQPAAAGQTGYALSAGSSDSEMDQQVRGCQRLQRPIALRGPVPTVPRVQCCTASSRSCTVLDPGGVTLFNSIAPRPPRSPFRSAGRRQACRSSRS